MCRQQGVKIVGRSSCMTMTTITQDARSVIVVSALMVLWPLSLICRTPILVAAMAMTAEDISNTNRLTKQAVGCCMIFSANSVSGCILSRELNYDG